MRWFPAPREVQNGKRAPTDSITLPFPMTCFRRPASIALLTALSIGAPSLSGLTPAFADPPRPSGSAKLGQDLIARGQALFEDQQYEESIQTLSGALVRPNNTKQQKIDIYRLLALNYITLQRKEEAEGAVRGVLALEPTYELPQRESPRFRDFFAAVKQKWEAEGRPGLVKESQPMLDAVTMKHSSPAEAQAHTQIALTATIDDPQERVTKVNVYYRSSSRSGSDAKFEQAAATFDGSHVSASIPPSAVKPPILEYYIEGVDKGGLAVVSRGDASAPLRIAIQDKGGGWVIPVLVASAVVVVAGGVLGGLAAGGVFNKDSGSKAGNGGGAGESTVSVSVGSSSAGVRW